MFANFWCFARFAQVSWSFFVGFGDSFVSQRLVFFVSIHSGVVKMASIRKRGQNSYLIVISRGYDYEGNRLKAAQKTVRPPKDLTPGQCKKWLNEQAVLFEREVQHDPQPVNHAMTLAAYTEHWLRDIAPGKLAASTYSRDPQDLRRILPALGHYKSTALRKDAKERPAAHLAGGAPQVTGGSSGDCKIAAICLPGAVTAMTGQPASRESTCILIQKSGRCLCTKGNGRFLFWV